MKKIKIVILLIAIALLFVAVNFNEKRLELTAQKEALELQLSMLDAQEKELMQTVSDLAAKIEKQERQNYILDLRADNIDAQKSEFSAKLPQTPFPFTLDEYLGQIIVVAEKTNVSGTFADIINSDEFSEEKNADGHFASTYIIKTQFNGNISLSFISGKNDEVYQIDAEFSSRVNEAEYDEMVNTLIAATITLTSDPYSIKDDYSEEIEEILETGRFLINFVIVESECSATEGATKIYCRN